MIFFCNIEIHMGKKALVFKLKIFFYFSTDFDCWYLVSFLLQFQRDSKVYYKKSFIKSAFLQ